MQVQHPSRIVDSVLSSVLFVTAMLAAMLAAPAATAQLLDDMTDARVVLEAPVATKLGKTDRVDASSLPVELEYNGVVFRAFSHASTVQGWIRFREAADWSDWLPMHIVRSATDDGTVMGGYRSAELRPRLFEFRFEVDADQPFVLVAAGVFDSRKDSDRGPGVRNGNVRPKRSGIMAGDVPPLITRDEWNAEAFIGQPEPLGNPGYDHLTFHHAAGFSATTREEGLAQVKAIQDLHQNVRGWSDIGYQFVIDRGGRLYQGRPFLDGSTTLEEVPRLALGAHVGGFNTGNIGVCLLGCYHPPEGAFCTDTITSEAYDAYVQTFAFLSQQYDVSAADIRGHRDFRSTACPGDNNYVLLPQLIMDVEQFAPREPLPDQLTLAPNYPNPFQERTTVRYYLDRDGVVSLKVYDTVGREVAVLVREFQQGGAWYSIDFDATTVSSGTYFYRLESEGAGSRKASRSATMTLVR